MTEPAESVHALVREKYGALARAGASGCGCSCACDGEADSLDMIGDAYKSVEGYVPEADLGLAAGFLQSMQMCSQVKPCSTSARVRGSTHLWRDALSAGPAKSTAST